MTMEDCLGLLRLSHSRLCEKPYLSAEESWSRVLKCPPWASAIHTPATHTHTHKLIIINSKLSILKCEAKTKFSKLCKWSWQITLKEMNFIYSFTLSGTLTKFPMRVIKGRLFRPIKVNSVHLSKTSCFANESYSSFRETQHDLKILIEKRKAA